MIHAVTTGRALEGLRRAAGRASIGAAAAVGFVVSASSSGPASAIGLGPVTQQSALGQSLRVVVPVIVGPGEDIGPECFRLAASEREVDGVPQLAFGRMSLERSSQGARLVVTNPQPVQDPVVRMTVQVGCDAPVRKEYVLLLDPAPIETPVVAADSPPRTELAQVQEPPAAATPARRTRGAERVSARALAGGTGEPARAERRPAAPPKARAPVNAQPRRSVRSSGPRLTVSSGAMPMATNPRASKAEQARAQQELADQMEAETVVLRQRIAELTAMVERMQEELRVAEAAQRATDQPARAATPAVDDAAKTAARAADDGASATPKSSSWWDQNWPVLAAIVALPLLVGALIRSRRQRAPQPAPLASASPPIPIVPTPTAAKSVLQNAPAGIAAAIPAAAATPPKKRPRRTPARDGASALAVSELLHVTEEARVYVALGHPERAIDVLNEHIKHVPRSMPAAWLMLLDLYHTSDRQQDFERLADEFHVHCNVQAPTWDSFATTESDAGGLETFPHIQREVTRLWRQPGCREYLEGLLYDNREGRRIGFPLAAYGEILMLLQILDAPPPVDIDSDLVNDGKLEPLPQRVGAAASQAPMSPARPADTPRAPRAPDAASPPAQAPLDLGANLDPAFARAKGTS